MFALLLMGMLALTFNIQSAKASGTIHIRADGSIDPPDAPISSVDNVTYTLTGNVTSDADGIVVERDNIVVDGADYTIQGTGSGTGIALSDRSNVTIRNVVIKKFFLGIELKRSTNNAVYGNDITANNGEGIWLYDSSKDCSIQGNHVTNNSGSGIRFGWTGLYSGASNTSITGNRIAFNNDSGIRLSDSDYNSISGNNITENSDVGVQLYLCSDNNLVGNNITNNRLGIWLGDWSTHNNIVENTITNNEQDGIYVYSSTDNDISKNRIATCDTGIHLLAGSSDNTISGNIIANNNYGFFLSSPFFSSQFTNHNSIVGNTITANNWGIALQNSSDNTIYHNFFTNNQNNIDLVITTVNVWDSGYPSGGNYWSDYTDVDQFSGQYQNQTGSDGIWDHPYVIDENNIDNYPVVPEFPSILILPLCMITTLLAAIILKRKRLDTG
jgi:parallel beta-helix repeat protein